MVFKRIIPSLLLSKNRLVKGKRFKNYRDAGKPNTTVRAFNYQGADEIILLDIDSSKINSFPDIDTIKIVAKECFVPLCVGGGIRNVDIANQIFDSGADKICLNTVAIENPNLIESLAKKYGSQAIVVSIDLLEDELGNYSVFDHRTNNKIKGLKPMEWIKRSISLGAGELKLTSVALEGSKKGFDFELLNKYRGLIDIPIIFEGGGGSLTDIEIAIKSNIEGIALGSMLIFSDYNLVKIQQHMKSKRLNIR